MLKIIYVFFIVTYNIIILFNIDEKLLKLLKPTVVITVLIDNFFIKEL